MEDVKWEDDTALHPFFIAKAPTVEEMEKSPGLRAMQAIIDDLDPAEAGEHHKKLGNLEFSKGDDEAMRKALACYEKALNVLGGKNAPLMVSLLSNCAMAHLNLKNYRQCTTLCAQVREHDPAHIKAYFRAAKALRLLRNYDEALEWVDAGLDIEADNPSLVAERRLVVQERNEYNKRQRLLNLEKRRAQKRIDDLTNQLMAKGVKLRPHSAAAASNLLQNPSGHEIRLVAGSTTSAGEPEFAFPAMFLYPEHGQSDFIVDFMESQTFADHVIHMMSSPIPWDTEHAYYPENIQVFYATETMSPNRPSKHHLIELDINSTLIETLRRPHIFVNGGLLSFVLIPRESLLRPSALEKYDKIHFLEN